MKTYQKLNQLIKIYKISIEEGEALVTLDEEFGYKHFIWKPEMSYSELERWWRRKLHFGNSVRNLPGKLINVDTVVYAPPCKEYKTYEEMIEGLQNSYYHNTFFERWFKLDESNLCHRASIFWDDYSFLRTPTGRYIHHMGWWPAKLQTEKDIREQIAQQTLEESKVNQ